MGKIRVYELAQKLGLDNKDLLEKLQEAGIDAKTHMSVLEEKDVRAFEAESAPKVEMVEEMRVRPGLIRRRRTEVPAAAATEEKAETEEPQVEAPAAAVEEIIPPEVPPVVETTKQEEVAPEAVQPLPSKEIEKTSVEEFVPELSAEVPSAPAPVATVEPESRIPETAPEIAAKEAVSEKAVQEPPRVVTPPTYPTKKPQFDEQKRGKKPERATASQAKILGRVELPQVAPPEQRNGAPRGAAPHAKGAPPSKAPARPPRGERPAPAERQGRPSAPIIPQAIPQEPLSIKEPRGGKKKKKGKGGDGAGDEMAVARRRQRMEVFEPDRTERYRKPKKAAKPLKKTEVTVSKAIKRIIRITDTITVGELAKRMGVKANDLIRELMRQGTMVTINHPLDFDTAAILASEFNYEVENVAFDEETILEHAGLPEGEKETPEDMKVRPPVVTIMGHVDHGKTSLLDAIRTTNVTAGEAGGITQHIGAYDVEIKGQKICFLDTPGHEAFTSMRARGAKATDIVVLVVAADDGVMPQTREAISHSKAAGVPIIVAVNKIDKPDANADRVRQELTEFELVPEEWGGETIFVEVSAKQKLNLDRLLEMILLQAEVLELKANPNKRAKGIVVEARLDKGRGPVATVLVQEGTLKIGDPIVTGVHYGRVRTMTDDRGNALSEAGPSVPVEVTGLAGVPEAGDKFHAVEDEKAARDVAQHRQQKIREVELAKTSKISLEQLYARIQEGEAKELKVIIKGDVQGSVEAVKESLLKLSTDACKLVVIHTGVGGIIESDVTLASASDAIVIGFNVRPEPKAASLAETEGVDIRLYNIIYDAVSDVRDAMEGLLAPTLKEKHLGRAEVRETFSVSKIGTIAGCYVLDGKIVRNAQVRLVRDSVVIWEGKLSSLKRFKDDVREVATGYECGIGLENYNDIKNGDVIEAFEMEEVKTTL